LPQLYILNKGWGQKTPVLRFHISPWQVQITRTPFTTLALKDHEFEERAFDFTKKHPRTGNKNAIRSLGTSATSRRRSPSVYAKIIGALMLGRSLPASNHKRQQTRGSRGRTTWQLHVAEHWRLIEKASAMDVELRPPSWPQIRIG
jgi:hypothetical protein